MELIFTARKTTLKDSFKDAATKKLGKFDRFFEQDTKAYVTVSTQKDEDTVEVTIVSGSLIFRAEKNAPDRLQALDTIIDILFKQIVRYKNKYVDKLRKTAFTPEEMLQGEEETFEIVRKKRFAIKPMAPEDAILEMNLIGHDFYMFFNRDSGHYAVVYRRESGGYGLIEPEE